MNSTPWLTVIGIGEDGLDGLGAVAKSLIAEAEILIGGERHLAMIPLGSAERQPWPKPFGVDCLLSSRGRRVVVLASGDPMWFGIGATLRRHLGSEEMLVLPAPGAFALAAARLGWPLAEAECLTLHGRPLDALSLFLVPNARLLALSEDGSTPAKAAALLCERGFGPSVITVLEHLGGPQERCLTATAASWSADTACADLNTLAIECRPEPGAIWHSRVPGLPDEAFRHDGQLTKCEVRAATLAALAPAPGALLWDVGAGSGAIAIEWLRAQRCRAIAVERNPERQRTILHNAATLGVPHLVLVKGAAPEALANLERPDAVFVGGNVALAGLLDQCWEALPPGGRLVANAVSLEAEAALLRFFDTCGGRLTRLAVSRIKTTGRMRTWHSLAPVTQLAALKP